MAETIIGKQCRTCKQTLSTPEFYRDRSKPDGLSSQCKACARAYNNSPQGKVVAHKYSRSHKCKAKALRYNQSELGRTSKERRSKAYNNRHPEQGLARTAVYRAIAVGILAPPESFYCGCKTRAAEYHHHLGYAQEPCLHVVPMCIQCHRDINLSNASHIGPIPKPGTQPCVLPVLLIVLPCAKPLVTIQCSYASHQRFQVSINALQHFVVA